MRRFMDASIASFLEYSCADCSSGYEGFWCAHRTKVKAEPVPGHADRFQLFTVASCLRRSVTTASWMLAGTRRWAWSSIVNVP